MILKYNNENGFCRLSSRTIIFLKRRSVQDVTICILFSTHRMSKNYFMVKQWAQKKQQPKIS